MNFQEAYKQLEDNFRHQVEEDRKLGIESIFLPNMAPKAPVDYVLIGMEPSLLGFARSLDNAQEKIDRGVQEFLRSLGYPLPSQELPVTGWRDILRHRPGQGLNADELNRSGQPG